MHGSKLLDGPDPTVYRFGSAGVKTKRKLPKKVNLKSKFSPVYEQNCGCCTTCAALGCDDYYYHGSAKPWVPSWKFTYYLQRKGDGSDINEDTGSIIADGLRCIRKYGACSSKVWSNDEPIGKKPSKEAFENGLKGHEVTKYYRITSFTQLREALAKKYPVAATMSWLKQTYDPETFILDSWTKEDLKKSSDYGHAIVVVGYDDNKKLIEIRNSWGPDWGNNGYIYMTYDQFKKNVHYSDTYAVIK